MRVLLYCLLACLSCFCHGDLTPYLKNDTSPKEEKSPIENIDFIYLINLNERPEKLKKCQEELKKYKIHPHRFSAVCGPSLPIETINNVGLKFIPGMNRGKVAICFSSQAPEASAHPEYVLLNENSYGKSIFFRRMTTGAIGCTLSHLSVLQDAYDAGFETIWVMEDDIVIKEDPNKLSSLIKKLDDLVGKEGWDILYTDSDNANASLYNKKQDLEKDLTADLWFFERPDMDLSNKSPLAKRSLVGEDFIKIGSRMRTHSMIIRRSGMKKILDFEKQRHICIPYDHEVALVPNIQMFQLRQDVITNDTLSKSDTHTDQNSISGPNATQYPFFELYLEGIGQKNENNTDRALELFFNSYAIRPSRAEPLLECAKIYREKSNVFLGYLLTKHALSLAFPKDELFVQNETYSYNLLIEFANCALLLGKFDEGLQACNQLLANPDLPQQFRPSVEANLKLAAENLGIAKIERSVQTIKNIKTTSNETSISDDSNFDCPKTIDILVQWDLQDAYHENWDTARNHGYNVRVFKLGYENCLAKIEEYFSKNYSENTTRVIIMEDFIPKEFLLKIPKSKRVLFLWEPIGKTEDNDLFSYVYTFNDNLIGTKNYRKFCYPFLMSMCSDPTPFKQKKLCTAVISHWLPERIQLIDFFKNHYQNTIDLFGNFGGPFTNHHIYKGPIAGYHSGSSKLNTLKNYKFFLAFENSACPRYNISSGYCAPGYISEKIFGAFAAGCVPIYYGAPNIETYIPKNCFVNYLDFQKPEDLYNYITNMEEEVYEDYLQNIRNYLRSDQAKQFSNTAFEAVILEAAINDPI